MQEAVMTMIRFTEKDLNLTEDERAVFKQGASALHDIEAQFEDKWISVGRAVVLARDCAARIDKWRKAYMKILAFEGIGIDGPTCSDLLRIMDKSRRRARLVSNANITPKAGMDTSAHHRAALSAVQSATAVRRQTEAVGIFKAA
jgi:hypothetical protein